jgi:AMP phosphorylase
MRLKLKKFEVSTGRPIAFINHDDAEKADIGVGERVQISKKKLKIQARVDVASNFIKKGEIALTDDILAYLLAKPGEHIEVTLMPSPRSSPFITKKMNGGRLSKKEIRAIIDDVINNALSEAEISEFIVGVYRNGMNDEETVGLTEAMCMTGERLHWRAKVIADKHCIGGIAGNRTTPIVVSICAAAGLVMPKTSSRAITSAAGTADVIETVSSVDFSAAELQRIVQKTGACLAWGGSLGLAPADDKLIRIERTLRLDPDSQLIASILSKKIAAGSTHVLIDIPYGEGAKVTKQRAQTLKENFLKVGKRFGLTMRVLLTDGSQPIGDGIGPVLEMIDALKVLHNREPPRDLQKKSLRLAGEIIELVGVRRKGEGIKLAREMLFSGAAAKKFEEIVNAQGRKNSSLEPGHLKRKIAANKTGRIIHIDNEKINRLATVLGCPTDKGAGIYLYKHVGDSVKKGEPAMTLYAHSQERLHEGVRNLEEHNPMKIA